MKTSQSDPWPDPATTPTRRPRLRPEQHHALAGHPVCRREHQRAHVFPGEFAQATSQGRHGDRADAGLLHGVDDILKAQLDPSHLGSATPVIFRRCEQNPRLLPVVEHDAAGLHPGLLAGVSISRGGCGPAPLEELGEAGALRSRHGIDGVDEDLAAAREDVAVELDDLSQCALRIMFFAIRPCRRTCRRRRARRRRLRPRTRP